MGPVERIEVELGDGAVLARDVTGCWSSPYREARAAFDEILRVVRP